MTSAWPWIMLAGLGAFHGLNPAMGWLFATALGLYRHSRTAVLVSIIPIAVGHLASVALVVTAFTALGTVVEPRILSRIGGALLLGWAAYHSIWGHRHRARFGMQIGLIGLAVWSFMMATAHGAGLMLIPALMPICFSDAGAAAGTFNGAAAVAGVLVHTVAMLATTTAIALAVYEWLGVGVLRKAWINVDLLWTLALAASGVILLLG